MNSVLDEEPRQARGAAGARQCFWLALLAAIPSGCLARSAQQVVLPDHGHAYRVQCNYSLSNCLREAEQTCHGPYEELSRGNRNCKDCGIEYNEANVTTGDSPVYRGVLYFRCKR